MTEKNEEKPSLPGFGAVRRKEISVSAQDLVRAGDLRPGELLPLLVEPEIEGLELAAWAEKNRATLEEHLARRGGVLFRGFSVRGEEDLQAVVQAVSGDLMEYTYRSTPRTRLSGRIYTSTEYPADQSIPLHNEMSYSAHWPMKVFFLCVLPAESQGETPIADSRRVFQRLDPALRERFAEKQVMYIRNYGEGVDLPWQDVFQTADRAEVEAFCRAGGIGCEWRGGDRLTTRQVCQAVARHPRTGEWVWFNQAHLFHVSSLPPGVREMLLETFGEQGVPRHACYGDGSPIEESAIAAVRGIYAEESVVFPWLEGDLLLLDNMLVAHGRRPYTGRRRVVVGMSEPMAAGR
jgi:alpha-ketoglutarate-dependent taurine dioxygenase